MGDIRFDGRVAIVTGAGGGLGREHALLLASRGAKVVVNDLGGATDGTGASAGPAEQTAKEIEDLGGVAVADASTVATMEGGQAIVAAALEAFGRVDVVISNAGILRDKAFHNLTPELLDPVLEVHLKGAFHVIRPAWVKMREAGYGRVLVTASNAGILGNFGQSNYGAAKMGLVGLARVLAQEGARHNIKASVKLCRTMDQYVGAGGVRWQTLATPGFRLSTRIHSSRSTPWSAPAAGRSTARRSRAWPRSGRSGTRPCASSRPGTRSRSGSSTGSAGRSQSCWRSSATWRPAASGSAA
jgi:NAD(P)-dependent dehydrogenase (short-subunit alcohol dehydrogenase family)